MSQELLLVRQHHGTAPMMACVTGLSSSRLDRRRRHRRTPPMRAQHGTPSTRVQLTRARHRGAPLAGQVQGSGQGEQPSQAGEQQRRAHGGWSERVASRRATGQFAESAGMKSFVGA